MQKQRLVTLKLARVLAVTMAFVAALLAPGLALAETVLEYEPQDNPVADNVTRVLVNKLRADTHEPIEGAHLVIYPASDPSTVVAEWVSTGEAHEIARTLDVNTRYVLHEISAPAGYGLASDVTFELYSEDFNTTGKIISGGGTNAEFDIISGSGPEQAFVISLYDPIKPAEEKKEIHRQREVERPASYQNLVKTGDLFNQPLFYGLLVAGVAAIAYGIWRRRKAQ